MTPNSITAKGIPPESLRNKLLPSPTVLAPRNLSVAVVRCKREIPNKHALGNLGTIEHIPAQKIRADLRDDAQSQPKFLAALNLLPKVEHLEVQKIRTISPSLNQKLRSRKDRIVSYFRNNPVPLSSSVGRQIIQKTIIGKCGNPEELVKKYEKNCKLATRRFSPTATEAANSWPQVNSRRMKKVKAAGNHVHKYSSGRNQRVERLTEIVMGLNKESFAALNQCQGFDIRVHRMTDEEIAFKIAEIEDVLQSLSEAQSLTTAPEITRWISSQPIAGASSGIETVATPVIKLWDFKVEAPVTRKSFESKKALKKQC